MNIAIDYSEYQSNNIFLSEPVENTVIDNSSFINLIYSTKYFTLSSLYIRFDVNDLKFERKYNKNICHFDLKKNPNLLQLIEIETNIIFKRMIPNKVINFRMKEQLHKNNFKVYTNIPLNYNEKINKGEFLLKISGIWETADSYGLTYKFIYSERE